MMSLPLLEANASSESSLPIFSSSRLSEVPRVLLYYGLLMMQSR
jgi:hypothetical protein